MNAPAVAVAGLAFSYGPARVLDDVSFEVAGGEIFGIVGADGAGKSTLLRVLIGQLAPAAGRATVLGMDAANPALREQLAYMPQSFGQYLDLTVLENIRFFAALHGLRGAAAAATIADLLARAGLRGFEARRAGQLSGGMMQKLALACALVSRPRVMFLDEPTTGVDPVSRRAFWQLLEGVRADGVAIVCTTANMDEAERCDRVATLEGGRLVREGAPRDLVRQVPAALCMVSGPGARERLAVIAHQPQVDLVFPVGRDLKVWLKPGLSLAALLPDLVRAGLAGSAVEPGLHDVALRELALAEREAAHA
jgi:ABC-2 type transport system ATP-binding protein